MKPSDRVEFGKTVTVLAEAFGRTMSPAFFEAYWIALEDLPLERIQHAARRAVRAARFMPTGAELRELAGEVPNAARAELAWEVFLRAVRRLGGYQSPDFEDRAINAVVHSLGGWERVTMLSSEELLSYTRTAFLKAYPAYREQAHGEAGNRLTGILERNPENTVTPVPVACSYLPAPEQRFLAAPGQKQIEDVNADVGG